MITRSSLLWKAKNKKQNPRVLICVGAASSYHVQCPSHFKFFQQTHINLLNSLSCPWINWLLFSTIKCFRLLKKRIDKCRAKHFAWSLFVQPHQIIYVIVHNLFFFYLIFIAHPHQLIAKRNTTFHQLDSQRLFKSNWSFSEMMQQ
jgi:hypothetical protein